MLFCFFLEIHKIKNLIEVCDALLSGRFPIDFPTFLFLIPRVQNSLVCCNQKSKKICCGLHATSFRTVFPNGTDTFVYAFLCTMEQIPAHTIHDRMGICFHLHVIFVFRTWITGKFFFRSLNRLRNFFWAVRSGTTLFLLVFETMSRCRRFVGDLLSAQFSNRIQDSSGLPSLES